MRCPEDYVVNLPVDKTWLINGHAGNLKSDLTLYFTCKLDAKIPDGFRTLSRALCNQNSIDCEVQLYDQFTPDRVPVGRKCRGLVCWCERRNSIAVTLRSHGITGSPPGVRKFLTGITHNFSADYECLLDILKTGTPSPLKGLIIVAGETGSGKSTLADLVFRDLAQGAASEHPHLIVLGKPIDWQPVTKDCRIRRPPPDYKGELTSNFKNIRALYTPRTIGDDTDLEGALVDALRQKPAGVYLDEIRKEEDWKPVLHFAGTGHFIVTTTHGGSVKDVITWMLKSLGVERRSQIPSYLANVVAVIHVFSFR
jgi:hypothetical protein